MTELSSSRVTSSYIIEIFNQWRWHHELWPQCQSFNKLTILTFGVYAKTSHQLRHNINKRVALYESVDVCICVCVRESVCAGVLNIAAKTQLDC